MFNENRIQNRRFVPQKESRSDEMRRTRLRSQIGRNRQIEIPRMGQNFQERKKSEQLRDWPHYTQDFLNLHAKSAMIRC